MAILKKSAYEPLLVRYPSSSPPRAHPNPQHSSTPVFRLSPPIHSPVSPSQSPSLRSDNRNRITGPHDRTPHVSAPAHPLSPSHPASSPTHRRKVVKNVFPHQGATQRQSKHSSMNTHSGLHRTTPWASQIQYISQCRILHWA